MCTAHGCACMSTVACGVGAEDSVETCGCVGAEELVPLRAFRGKVWRGIRIASNTLVHLHPHFAYTNTCIAARFACTFACSMSTLPSRVLSQHTLLHLQEELPNFLKTRLPPPPPTA